MKNICLEEEEEEDRGNMVTSHLTGLNKGKIGISCTKRTKSTISLPNQLVPRHCHISNHLPHGHLDVIRTKIQVIKICKEILRGLVSTKTKIQLSPICKDYRHI